MKNALKSSVLLGAAILVVSGCGGADTGESSTTFGPTTTLVEPSTTTTQAVRTTSEAGHPETSMHSDDDSHDEEGVETERDIEIVMDEFTFEPSSYVLEAGETIRFVVSNEGKIEHEFRLSNQHRIEEHLASGHEDHYDESADHHEEDGDIVLVVQPGEVGEVVVTVPEDMSIYTEVACLLPGHYEAGMKAPITYS